MAEKPASWTAANWIALSEFIVALCSFGLSMYVAYLNRSHQRLTVRPHLQIGFYYNAQGAHFSLDNWGLGPAQLKWFEVTVDGKPQRTWREVLNTLGVAKNVAFQQSIPARGILMQPGKIGQSTDILSVPRGAPTEALIKARDRLTLRACYCSLYEECWLATSDRAAPEQRSSCDPAPKVDFIWER